MRSFAIIMTLLLAILMAKSVMSGTVDPSVDDHGNPRLKDFVRAPEKVLGKSRSNIVTRLGKPRYVDIEKFPNLHDPSVTNYRYHLHSQGLHIEILDIGGNKEIIETVALEKDFPELTLDIRMGDSQVQVRAVLPHPYRED